MGYFIVAMVLFGFLFSGIAFRTGSTPASVAPAPPASRAASPSPSPSLTPAGAAIPDVAR